MLQEDDVLTRATELPFLSAVQAKNDTTNLFYYKLGESTENNKALLFLSGKETTVPFKPLSCCLRSDKLARENDPFSLETCELPCLKILQRSFSRDLIR